MDPHAPSPPPSQGGPPDRLLSRRTLLRQLGAAGALAGVYTLLPAAVRAAPAETSTSVIDRFPAGTGGRSEPVASPLPFGMVGFELAEGMEAVEFRTSLDGAGWGPWTLARTIAADGEGPDPGSTEARPAWRRMTHPVWVGEARWVQVRGPQTDRVRAHLIDPAGLSRSATARAAGSVLDALAAAPAEAVPYQPQVITRAAWGADESWRKGTPGYAASLRFAVIHHTAGANDYSQTDVPAILRGIYRYHTQTLGWADIGYNLLVDRFGRIFEGRHGGIERPVVGAHASGYNSGSVGVAALGCFDDSCRGGAVSSAMLDALDQVVAWKFARHGIDPYGTSQEGSTRLPTIVGHRDVGSTACPGGELYRHVRGASSPMSQRVWARIHGFRDVPPSSPFASDIAWIAAAGITTGTNPPANDLFLPKASVTRGQMAAFLVRGLRLTDDAHPGFRDVPAGSTFDRDIRRIARAGITDGCTTDRFCPNDPVTRGQMAAFLARGLRLTDDAHPGFRDVPPGSIFDRDIRRIARAGITRGCTTDRFCPNDPVTREQMAAFLHRAL